MGERMDKRIRFYIYWILGFVLLGACAPGDKEDVYTEMRAFEDFSHINGDSVAIVPRKVRLKAFQKMEEAKDSLVKYNYLAMTLKTYLITSQLDSAQIVIQQIHDFIAYIIHSGFISGYQNRYGDNLKPPTNVYHRMTA